MKKLKSYCLHEDITGKVTMQEPDNGEDGLYYNANDVDAVIEQQRREVERLKGVKPELPPFPPNGSGLPRYGISWNGQYEPITKPMDDGYWTPWHLADEVKQERDAIAAHVERVLDLRDKLNSEEFESCDWFHLFDGLMNCIKFQPPQTSLSEVRSKQAKGSYYQGWIDCIEGEGQQDEHSQWRESPFAEGKRLSEQHAAKIREGGE